jgi:hypothetical protein
MRGGETGRLDLRGGYRALPRLYVRPDGVLVSAALASTRFVPHNESLPARGGFSLVTRIADLPQLINLLRGEVALENGPRRCKHLALVQPAVCRHPS